MNETYSLVTYTKEKITHNAGANLTDLLAQVDPDCNIWVTVNGYSAADREAIAQLFAFFEIDPALADDIVDETRPGFIHETPQYLFFDASIPHPDSRGDTYRFGRGTVILNRRAVILFDRDRSGYFDPTRNKILAGSTRAQEFGPDYIFYLLLRTAIANVKRFMLVDLADRFEALEDEVIENPGEGFVLDDILTLRQQMRPLYDPLLSSRELIDYVLEEESRFIAPHTRDLFERHLEKDSDQLWEGYSQLRDWSSVLLQIHHSNMNEKSSDKLNLVAIITFIFLPITFLTGLYGMNFAYIPELEGQYNYFILLGLMVVIAIGMVAFMKKKKMDLRKFRMKTILIVDDQRLARNGLKALLAQIPEFEVVGEVANGQEAIQWVAANLPDIVIMDVKMPVMDGLTATRHIKQLNLPVKVIVLSASITGETEALDAGADAFVSKYDPQENLLAALRLASGLDEDEVNNEFDPGKKTEV